MSDTIEIQGNVIFADLRYAWQFPEEPQWTLRIILHLPGRESLRQYHSQTIEYPLRDLVARRLLAGGQEILRDIGNGEAIPPEERGLWRPLTRDEIAMGGAIRVNDRALIGAPAPSIVTFCTGDHYDAAIVELHHSTIWDTPTFIGACPVVKCRREYRLQLTTSAQ